ncbi:MAG: hypothetical protein F6K10_07065 [Moorea sp. SIO2B7]|nr:hypothetical protein [Moorena sp. SIO2B7]
MANVFIDFNDITRVEKYLDFIILIIVAFSIYFLFRYTPMRIWLFILILIGVTALGQIIPDLMWQGRRSLQARYFLLCFFAIQLSVAYLITNFMKPININIRQRIFGQAIFMILSSLGIVSGVLITQTKDWDYLAQK